jgi:hypothetical protein
MSHNTAGYYLAPPLSACVAALGEWPGRLCSRGVRYNGRPEPPTGSCASRGGSEVRHAELTLEGGDPRHSQAKVRLHDRSGAEGGLETLLLVEDFRADPLRVALYPVEDPPWPTIQ